MFEMHMNAKIKVFIAGNTSIAMRFFYVAYERGNTITYMGANFQYF